MALSQRISSLTLDRCPNFAESLAAGVELQAQRQPGCEQQLAACRALVRSLPSTLPSGAAAQLVTLASSWLAGCSSTSSGDSQAPAAATQLQAEAARLYSALFDVSKVKLQSGACRQLLQQLCRLCRGARSAPTLQQQPQPASSLAEAELACACLDLLAQLSHWYPQPPTAEVAAAVAAVAAALERQVQAGRPGGGATATLAETPPTTRLLCKLLRALQVLLAEAKKDHGANVGGLALLLQRLFTYGWQERSSSGRGTPKRGSGGLAVLGATADAPDAGAASAPAATAAADAFPLGAARPPTLHASAGPAPPSTGKYRPPHARNSSAREQNPAAGSAALRRITVTNATQAPLESSDSESSDAESVAGGGGARHHAGRVRSAALACLQLLAKADPRSLHGNWTALLPATDALSWRRNATGGALVGGGAGASIAHVLLHDPQLRVRHAAAATLATLLEGPAQRAYLAVAEARELERQPVRGFTTLSASLGQTLVSLHQALLHSMEHERDALVLAATLRALGTLLLGAPYHRLPPQLLPLCVRALAGCLVRVTLSAGAAALPHEQLPVASACLSCLAAAFSCKGAAAALAGQLHGLDESVHVDAESRAEAAARGSRSSSTERPPQEQQRPQQQQRQQQPLLQLLFDYAACQHPALQLEALMALRGVAQQHTMLLAGCWGRLLALGRAGPALQVPSVPQSPRLLQGPADGTVQEKLAQQGVRLPGDYLQASEHGLRAGHGSAEAAGVGSPAALAAALLTAGMGGLVAQWQELAEQVLAPAVQHSSPLLRAAAQAAVSGMSPRVYAALPQPQQQQLLGWCCVAAAGDEASPVRAAGAKALGALAASPAMCTVPEGPAQMLAALTASCRDSVLAVRIPAAAALASLCSTLGHTVAAASGAGQCGGPEADAEAHAAATAAGRAVLPACLRLAASAAGDSDKLRPSGLQAIGSLFQLHTQLAALEGKGGAAALPAASEVAPLLAAAAQAVQQCLASGSARVQWAACEAAGALLACPPPQAQPRWAALLPQLAALLQSGRNFRSRALAAAALRQLDGSAALPAGSLLGLLEQVAAVLFEGKAHGFAAAPAAHETQQERHRQPEPADLGSKAQLEAALVAAVLHLLAMLPHAPAGIAGEVGERHSRHVAELRRLVQQAQDELLQQAEGAGEGLFSAAAAFGAGLFDLSQVPAPLAAAAAAGLVLLH